MRFIFKAALNALLLLLTISSFASPIVKCSLQGKVTDSAGQPLAGVIIEVPDIHTGAASDANGNYIIKDLPQGNYLVTARLLSFGSQSKMVKINSTTIFNIKLSESV